MQRDFWIADMHTHSEHSHDSVCPIEEMCRAQIERGTRMMAVTDHFDTESYQRYDVHTPIRRAYEQVQAINARMGEQITLLSGVEISEGFWFPAEYERIITASPYDVVIGSVHLVRYEGHREAYSKIDFSAFSEEEIYAYLDAYFDDMLTMLAEIDFDILAHLTCPIRYVTGKYGIAVDLSRFAQKIERILRCVIETGRALEINTSGLELLGDVMPERSIIERYLRMGGTRLTIGSDAHIAQNASANFDAVLPYLRSLGIKELYYYQNRTPIAYSII